jgi:hypothetical protein
LSRFGFVAASLLTIAAPQILLAGHCSPDGTLKPVFTR